MFKIDREKLKSITGIENINKSDLIFYIKSILYNLKTYDENYTEAQRERIKLLFNIFECVEV